MFVSTLPVIADAEGNYDFQAPVTATQILDLAASILEHQVTQGEALTSPEQTKTLLTCRLGHLEREVFCCLFLDSKHRIIAMEELFQGTIDGASVYPREVVKTALKYNAAALIFAHNHPSGVTDPSSADQALTRRLKEACALVDIRVLDHIIVGGSKTTSLSERGLL